MRKPSQVYLKISVFVTGLPTIESTGPGIIYPLHYHDYCRTDKLTQREYQEGGYQDQQPDVMRTYSIGKIDMHTLVIITWRPIQ